MHGYRHCVWHAAGGRSDYRHRRTDLLAGVIIGFGLSLFRPALLSSRLKIGLHNDATPGEASLHLDGSTTFLKVPSMARTLERVPNNTRLTLVLDRLSHVDQACLEVLREWSRNASARGCELVVDWKALHARVKGQRAAA